MPCSSPAAIPENKALTAFGCVENDGQNKSITIDKNYYRWRSLDREVGLNLYGSRYRKASSNKGWGMTLSCLVAPALLVGSLAAVDSEVPGVAVVGDLALNF